MVDLCEHSYQRPGCIKNGGIIDRLSSEAYEN